MEHLDPEAIIRQHYPAGITRERLLRHGELVACKAFEVLDRAPWMHADRNFVRQAAFLHDIGIGRTHCPELGCTGDRPYVCHGIEGRAMLDAVDLERHGLVCERHVGVGIRAAEALARKLPLPARDMLPLSVAERLICYADKFFSKTDNGRHEKSIAEITASLFQLAPEYEGRFLALHRAFTREPAG